MDARPALLVHTESAFYEPEGVKSGSPEPGARSSAGERPLHTRKVVGSKPTAPTSPSRRRCYVYLVTNTAGHVKIGHSADPKGRLASLGTASPYKLEVYRTWRLPSREKATSMERQLHEMFRWCRLNREWHKTYAYDVAGVADALFAKDVGKADRIIRLLTVAAETQDNQAREDEWMSARGELWRMNHRQNPWDALFFEPAAAAS